MLTYFTSNTHIYRSVYRCTYTYLHVCKCVYEVLFVLLYHYFNRYPSFHSFLVCNIYA